MKHEEFIEKLAREERAMKRMRLRARAGALILAFHHLGDHEATEIMRIVHAALDYGDSMHARDAHCSAGDCDNCTARDTLKELEKLLGGPEPYSE